VAKDGSVEREGAQIEIGGNNRYVPLCRKHFSQSVNTGVCAGWRPG
jgi:thymidine kinase